MQYRMHGNRVGTVDVLAEEAACGFHDFTAEPEEGSTEKPDGDTDASSEECCGGKAQEASAAYKKESAEDCAGNSLRKCPPSEVAGA
ncbi:hypothetical protein AB0M86_43075 [Streptomyces sp. NPDC051639]|uniref:hypothetical protein n=1 Tax=Streptomyces sp. NPDC051639 TaxID=3155671 RepID=UPI00342D671B